MIDSRDEVRRMLKKAIRQYFKLIDEASVSPRKCVVSLFSIHRGNDLLGIYARVDDGTHPPVPLGRGYHIYNIDQMYFHNSGINEDVYNFEDEISYMNSKDDGAWNHEEFLSVLNDRVLNGEIPPSPRDWNRIVMDNRITARDSMIQSSIDTFVKEVLESTDYFEYPC